MLPVEEKESSVYVSWHGKSLVPACEKPCEMGDSLPGYHPQRERHRVKSTEAKKPGILLPHVTGIQVPLSELPPRRSFECLLSGSQRPPVEEFRLDHDNTEKKNGPYQRSVVRLSYAGNLAQDHR